MDNKDELIKKYEKTQKQDRVQKIVLVLVIIVILLLWILSYRLWKIDNQEVFNPTDGNINLIKVEDNYLEIDKDTKLNIFENEKFNGQKKISPKSKGEYTFCIKNISNNDIKYNIDFTDQMEHHINMKYKLKIDNVYIRGNEENYIDIEDLNVKDIISLKDTINVFSLEWYWQDDDEKDTIVGSIESNEYYTLNLKIQVEEYKKSR